MIPSKPNCLNVKLKPFFESSVDMLCIANYDGYFVDVNPAFVKLLGYSQEELFSKKINEFVFEEDRNTTQQVREGIHKNEPLINFHNRYISKSGELVWLSWSAVPVDEEQLVYAIAKDITHEQSLKNERFKEMNRLKDDNENLFRLNYTTSHDLRAPIDNLLSFFELLDYKKIKDKETLEILEYMELSAKSVKESLENYVDMVRGVKENSNYLQEVYFENTLKRITNTVGSLLTTSKTEISSDFSYCESVFFDKCYMESIFLNLITNSVKYARPGIPPRINIKTQVSNGKKELIFTDQGQGFDLDKNGDKIFGLSQRFHTNQEGKGVGLYLIHNQISSLGGSISVKSEPNRGASFYIRFAG